jgi:hypothetical protein
VMTKLLGASALALTLSIPAAHAAHRHGYVARVTGRHHDQAPRQLASRRAGWRHRAMATRYGVRGGSFGESHAEATLGDEARDAGRPTHAAGLGPRPGAWCGWYARQLVGSDPGPAYNLARNWARWGRASSPGVGVMVVWPHHVGMITGQAPNGQWIVKSGNDGGGKVRERARSIAGAIAFRAS